MDCVFQIHTHTHTHSHIYTRKPHNTHVKHTHTPKTKHTVEIEALKHAPQWGLRNRRDSISGFSTHSQPMGHYTFGTQSPAQTYHSGELAAIAGHSLYYQLFFHFFLYILNSRRRSFSKL